MRTFGAAFQAHLDQPYPKNLNLTVGIRIARADGVVLRGIAWDKDKTLTSSFGSELYKAQLGVNRSSLSASSDMTADQMELAGILAAATVTEADISAGRYDKADIYAFLCIPTDTTIPVEPLTRGFIGEIKTANDFSIEVRSLLDHFGQELLRPQTTGCRFPFMGGGSGLRCAVVEDPAAWAATTAYSGINQRKAIGRAIVKPTVANDRYFELLVAGTSGASEPTWSTTLGAQTVDGTCTWVARQARLITATVATVTSRSDFTVTVTTDAPNAFFADGLVTFTSGSNQNVEPPIEIEAWTLSTKRVQLGRPVPATINVGDALTLRAGCNLTMDQGTFNCQYYGNQQGYGGWNHKPGDRQVLQT